MYSVEMEQSCNILVIWRGKQFDVNVNPDSNVKEFGQKLQELTNVRPDTMRLFVPQKNNKGSKMLSPFSDVHSMLSLRESAILEVNLHSYCSMNCFFFFPSLGKGCNNYANIGWLKPVDYFVPKYQPVTFYLFELCCVC